MKKIITLCLTLFISIFAGKTQSILNGDFETWQSVDINEPTGAVTANLEMFHRYGGSGQFLVTKVTDSHSGMYACKAETKVINNDTTFGYVVFGKTGENGPEGGYPYTQKPDSIVGWYKSNIVSSDSALLLVSFSLNGAPVYQNMFFLKGTHSTYTRFSFPLNLPTGFTCDTTLVGFASSNPFTEFVARPGSWITMDDISFVGTGITQQIPNSNFESWNTLTFEKPTEWLTLFDYLNNGSVSKTTDKYAGVFAANIKTIQIGGNILNVTFNGQQSDNGPIGGQPFTLNADTLIGYYKYTPQGIDTAIVGVQLKKDGTTLLWNFKYLYSASTYTQFSLPFNTLITPDTIVIYLGSSTWNATSACIGSQLIIDEVQLKSQPLSTMIKENKQLFLNMLYPNPAHGEIFVEFSVNSAEEATCMIFDVTGKLISATPVYAQVGNNKKSIDIGNLPNGMYTLSIETKTKHIRTSKFIVK